MSTGIYTITAPSGKAYVGQSTHCAKRLRAHLSALKGGRHCNEALSRAYSKYNEKLLFKVECELPREHLDEFEQLVIDLLGKDSYNQSPVIAQGYLSEENRAARRESRINALRADPTLGIRQSASITITTANRIFSLLVEHGLLLLSRKGLGQFHRYAEVRTPAVRAAANAYRWHRDLDRSEGLKVKTLRPKSQNIYTIAIMDRQSRLA